MAGHEQESTGNLRRLDAVIEARIEALRGLGLPMNFASGLLDMADAAESDVDRLTLLTSLQVLSDADRISRNTDLVTNPKAELGVELKTNVSGFITKLVGEEGAEAFAAPEAAIGLVRELILVDSKNRKASGTRGLNPDFPRALELYVTGMPVNDIVERVGISRSKFDSNRQAFLKRVIQKNLMQEVLSQSETPASVGEPDSSEVEAAGPLPEANETIPSKNLQEEISDLKSLVSKVYDRMISEPTDAPEIARDSSDTASPVTADDHNEDRAAIGTLIDERIAHIEKRVTDVTSGLRTDLDQLGKLVDAVDRQQTAIVLGQKQPRAASNEESRFIDAQVEETERELRKDMGEFSALATKALNGRPASALFGSSLRGRSRSRRTDAQPVAEAPTTDSDAESTEDQIARKGDRNTPYQFDRKQLSNFSRRVLSMWEKEGLGEFPLSEPLTEDDALALMAENFFYPRKERRFQRAGDSEILAWRLAVLLSRPAYGLRRTHRDVVSAEVLQFGHPMGRRVNMGVIGNYVSTGAPQFAVRFLKDIDNIDLPSKPLEDTKSEQDNLDERRDELIGRFDEIVTQQVEMLQAQNMMRCPDGSLPLTDISSIFDTTAREVRNALANLVRTNKVDRNHLFTRKIENGLRVEHCRPDAFPVLFEVLKERRLAELRK